MDEPKVGDHWYRYRDSKSIYSSVAELPFPDTYVVVKATKCTVLIQPLYGTWKNPKRLYIGSGASYAKPTLMLALASYVYRKRRAIGHYSRKLADAKLALEIGKYMVKEQATHPKLLSFENPELLKIMYSAPRHYEDMYEDN